MKPFDLLTKDQRACIDRLYQCDATLLAAGMGSGKSVCCLTAISDLFAEGVLSRVLVVAPLRVCKTVWGTECSGWEHLAALDVGVACGNAGERLRVLGEGHAITVINFENLAWLFRGEGVKSFFRDRPELVRWDGLVVDEITRFRAVGGQEFKALRRVRKSFKWVVGMTGTAVAEDWSGLYGMMRVVDGGVALGTNRDTFMRRYFYQMDYAGYVWDLKPDGAAQLAAACAGVVYTVPDYRDSLPALHESLVWLDAPESVMNVYGAMARDMAVTLQGVDVSAASMGVLSGKLLQLTSGFMYTGADGAAEVISDFKIERVMQEVEARRGPMVVCYWWQCDLGRLEKSFSEMDGLRWAAPGDDMRAIDWWCAGELDVLLLHPRCLHPDTEVLTEFRGWRRIVDVRMDDRVYDGVEFVAHSGCVYSGREAIKRLFGVGMTMGHKMLIDGAWREAKDVIDCEDTRQAARYTYAGDDKYLSEMLTLRGSVGGVEAERGEAQQDGEEVADVYDLVNCGPRSRFVVRNDMGEVFISHNSAGHGLNLAAGGADMLWIGPVWSLDLYSQTVARLWRRGQLRGVNVRVLCCSGTIDEAVWARMKGKEEWLSMFAECFG